MFRAHSHTEAREIGRGVVWFECHASQFVATRGSPWWRSACPTALRAPWLFAVDPMTFSGGQYADDDKLCRDDLSLLSTTLKWGIARVVVE